MLKNFIVMLFCLIPLGHGCARTDTTTPCTTLDETTAGLTIDSGTTLQDAGVDQDPIAQCSSCTFGSRQFYTETTATVPSDAIANAEVSEGVQCPDPSTFCTCNTAGVCCTPGAVAPDTVLFIPVCDGGTCFQNVVIQGDDGVSLTCTDQSTFVADNDETLGSSVYFRGDSVSCSGCTNIQNNQCELPILPV